MRIGLAIFWSMTSVYYFFTPPISSPSALFLHSRIHRPLPPVLSLFYLSSRPLRSFSSHNVLMHLGRRSPVRTRSAQDGLSIGSAAATVLLFAISYPLVLDVQQGNCEWILWLVLMVGLCAFLADRPALAAVFLGLGAAIKLYPIISWPCSFRGANIAGSPLGWLPFSSHRSARCGWRAAPLRSPGPVLIRGLTGLDKGFILHPMDFWDHSLFEFFKGAQALGHPEFLSQAASLKLQRFYLLVGRNRHRAVLDADPQNASDQPNSGSVTASVLLPPISMDYTLIHLFLPCGLLILGELRNAKSGVVSNPTGVRAALLTFACLFAPMTELTLYGHTLSNTVRTIALIALFVISLRYPLEATESLQQREPSKIEAALAA